MSARNLFEADPQRAEEPTHLVVRTARGELSLWPAVLPVPRGWEPLNEPSTHEDCVKVVQAETPR